MEKKYIGTRHPASGTTTVVVEAGSMTYDLPARLDVADYSRDGFEWGYTGSGPTQLSLALLLDLFPISACHIDGLPFETINKLKEQLICKLPRTGNFTITTQDLKDALSADLLSADLVCPECDQPSDDCDRVKENMKCSICAY